MPFSRILRAFNPDVGPLPICFHSGFLLFSFSQIGIVPTASFPVAVFVCDALSVNFQARSAPIVVPSFRGWIPIVFKPRQVSVACDALSAVVVYFHGVLFYLSVFYQQIITHASYTTFYQESFKKGGRAVYNVVGRCRDSGRWFWISAELVQYGCNERARTIEAATGQVLAGEQHSVEPILEDHQGAGRIERCLERRGRQMEEQWRIAL
jgi:hypothetical protein